MSNSTTIRRTIGVVALILAPFFNWMAALLTTLSTETKAAETLDEIAADTTRETLGALSDAVGVVFFIPAVLTMVHLLKPRAPRWAHITGAMFLAGLVGFAGMHAFEVIQVEMAKSPDREAMIALWDKIQDSALVFFVALFLLGQVLAFLFMSIGLFLTRSIPRFLVLFTWVFLVWDVGLNISGVDPQIANIIDPHMVGFIGSAITGYLVLRMGDDAWERGDALTWPPAPAAAPATSSA
jgi:hypothetical protein